MATGDILSCVFRADGLSADVVIDGFVVGATYDFGSLGNTPPTTTSPKFTATVVSEGYSASGVLGTITRTLHGSRVARVPATAATITGTYVSGTFVDGELVTQAVTGATAIVLGAGQSAGTRLRVRTVTGTPNNVNVWSGATASFTATQTPVTLAANTPDELGAGTSSLKVRVAFTEDIYADDKNGGAGTSGTNPTVTISAAWATNTGGASQTSAAATNLACTNNSTLTYPKVIAQWAWGHTPAWKRVTSAFDMGMIAYHGHGIACAALSATEGANVISGIATTKTAHQENASSLYYESYDLPNVSLTSMTQGNDVILRGILYPLVGDASSILDTSTNTTSTDDILGLTQITCTCDKAGALIDYAVVSTAGNDTTGAKSTVLATAAAAPYLTVGKALASGATVIYLRAGMLDWLGSTPVSVTQRNYAIEVAPYPGETVELQRQSTWKQYKAKILEYRDFSGTSEIKCVSATGYLDGNSVAAAKVFFRNNRFTATTPCGNPGTAYRSEGCWWINNTHAADEDFRGFSTSRLCYSLTGNDFTATLAATGNKPIYGLIANKTLHSLWAAKTATMGGPAPTNVIFANNSIKSVVVNGSSVFRWADTTAATNAVDGLAFVGNVVEVKTITSSTALLYIGADSSVLDVSNVVLAHNTIVGERCNLFYNDTGTVANVRKNIFCRNNAFKSFNIKADVFGTPSGARIGNWAQVNGVNFSDNRYDGTVDANFTCDWDGINVSYVTAKDAVFGQLGYTDDNSADGDGTGNGNYIPAAGSVLKGHTLRQSYLTYTQTGAALINDIGALASGTAINPLNGLIAARGSVTAVKNLIAAR